jgi:hypothetical protein
MSWGTGFFSNSNNTNEPIPELRDINHVKFNDSFAKTYTKSMYQKIMYECADRAILPDNVDKSAYHFTVYNSVTPRRMGITSILIEAMIEREHLFLQKVPIEKRDVGRYRFDEITRETAFSDNGNIKPDVIELDFSEFEEVTAILLLFTLLKDVLLSTSKGVNLSQASLLKIHNLSAMMDTKESLEPMIEQIKEVNRSIRKGAMGCIDAKSSLEFVSHNTEPNVKASDFIFGLISSITGMPKSWLFGEVVTGLGSGDNGDEVRANSAIKRYFYDIYAGMVYSIYNRPFEYKTPTQDVSQLINMFTFVETSSLLTEDAKRRFLINNAGFVESDFKKG